MTDTMSTPLDREVATNAKLRAENEALRAKVELYTRGQALRSRNEELRAQLAQYQQGAPLASSVAKPLKRKELEKIEAAFKAVDTDGSGTIDALELKAAAAEMCEPMSDEDVNNALAAMDIDGSGSISFEEFKNWWLTEDKTSAKGMKLRMLRLKMKTVKTARIVRQRSVGLKKTISTGRPGDKGVNLSFSIGDVGEEPKGGFKITFVPTDKAEDAAAKAAIGADDAVILVTLTFPLLGAVDAAKVTELKELIEAQLVAFEHIVLGGDFLPGVTAVKVSTDCETALHVHLCAAAGEEGSEIAEIMEAFTESPFNASMFPKMELGLVLSRTVPEYMQGEQSLLEMFAMELFARGEFDESINDMAALMGEDAPVALLKTLFAIFGGVSMKLKLNSLGSVSKESIDTVVTEWLEDDELQGIIGYTMICVASQDVHLQNLIARSHAMALADTLQQPGDELGKQARKQILKLLGMMSSKDKTLPFCKIYNLARECLAGFGSIDVRMPNGHGKVAFNGFNFPAWLPPAMTDLDDDETGDDDEDDEEDIWS